MNGDENEMEDMYAESVKGEKFSTNQYDYLVITFFALTKIL